VLVKLHVSPLQFAVKFATGGWFGAVQVTEKVVLPVPPIANARRGWLYVQIFTAEGGDGPPYTFDKSAGTLPPGLALSSLGVLAGLPTTAGTYTFTVRATDDLGLTGTREYTLIVNGLRIEVGGFHIVYRIEREHRGIRVIELQRVPR